MKRFLAVPLALAITIGGLACSTADKMCQSASGAGICLNATGGGSYAVTGSGLQPGSAVHIRIPGPGLPFEPSKADDHGLFPETGVVHILGGITATNVPIDVTSAGGTAVTFTFRLPPTPH
jgi:hypothetical protein